MAPNSKKVVNLLKTIKQIFDNVLSGLRAFGVDDANPAFLQSKLQTLETHWNSVCQNHADIIDKNDADAQQYLEEDFFMQLQTAYETARAEVVGQLDRASPSTSASNSSGHVTSVIPVVHDAKLPKLDLPSFSGCYTDWDNFCDLFTSLVHNRANLSGAAKLQYLKLSLTGSAAEFVKGIAVTDANYNSTWCALKLRFCNPRLTVKTYLDRILKLPTVKKDSAEGLCSLIDELQRILRALTNLGLSTENWDVWLVHLVTRLLDAETQKAWELELSLKDRSVIAEASALGRDPEICNRFPKFSELNDYLERRYQSLGMVSMTEKIPEEKKTVPSKQRPFTRGKGSYHGKVKQSDGQNNRRCAACAGRHAITSCSTFIAKEPKDRLFEARRLKLCFNCLGSHMYSVCKGNAKCNVCQGRHHELLHGGFRENTQTRDLPAGNSSNRESVPTESRRALTAIVDRHVDNRVLLPTAQILLRGMDNEYFKVRALLDQGSESSFIRERVVQLLGLRRERVNISLTGLGAVASGTAKWAVEFPLHSIHGVDSKIFVRALVLRTLTSKLPSDLHAAYRPSVEPNLKLADPSFFMPGSIDVILGAAIYSQILQAGLYRFPGQTLIAQETTLGWIISGSDENFVSRRAVTMERGKIMSSSASDNYHVEIDRELRDSLLQLWREVDICPAKVILSPENEHCEQLFIDSHVRGKDGRYSVRLPIKGELPDLRKDTRELAANALLHLHKRFSRDSVLASEYRLFMSDYEKLGHMQRVTGAEDSNSAVWFLPHFAVIQASGDSRKLRVVFDASRPVHGDQCLNKYLLPGPSLQRDMPLILLNWRQFRYVFTADIIKMFRQISVDPRDRDLQRILWSPTGEIPPVEYRLNTVTYGTACAPYLAIRTLQQLAHDEINNFPLGSICLMEDTYVDDIFAGANELSDALQKRREVCSMLETAGIHLDKWASNCPDLIPDSVRSRRETPKEFINHAEVVKTLGVRWNHVTDSFGFKLDEITRDYRGTMRSVMSGIARLFDPLGWLSPVTVTAKIILQDIWILKCNLDTPLPIDVKERWLSYSNSLPSLSQLRIDRWIGAISSCNGEIHGFSDASSRAYAAVVYLRLPISAERFTVTLLIAKAKVSPIKTMSIPNLELAAAALLTKLIKYVQQLDFLKELPVYAWTDSQIVLSWLRKHPCYWKTYVANRVAMIQTELPSAQWSHVRTKENPADMATRGIIPQEIVNCSLWWHGPTWLSSKICNIVQENNKIQSVHVHKGASDPDLLLRFSTLTRLLRVTAYCLRPLRNLCRSREGHNKEKAFLTTAELENARRVLIRMIQERYVASEICTLTGRSEATYLNSNCNAAVKTLHKNHYLSKLRPFVGEDGLLRVEGRLMHSHLCHEAKYPPILPKHSALSRLFVRNAHHNTLHGGFTLTMSRLLQSVWILGRSILVKAELRTCIVCQRFRPRVGQQLMGSLPSSRVTSADRPFTNTGVDYAGPIQIRTTKGRGYKSYKGYIAVFVCFRTRAIHLEVVSDLTTASFLAAYRRFAGRRGLVRRMYSDNGTTFIGAARELQEMFNASSKFYKEVAAVLSNEGTDWKLTTVLVEIEVCLNSRPLCPLNNDVDDIEALTPAHFLIGGPLGVVPEEELPQVPENRLTRFQLFKKIRDNFWIRWSREYLHTLQQRGKWKTATENLEPGRLVLIKDDHYPPSKWPLGRITETHVGPDGLLRVVTVKTASGLSRRHIARICPLQLPSSNQSGV
ncbi:uncharacterized protein [Prorops nasuta]|uniref:uncharacterized protein n=1 Tax=Prorops nasuta TaxID=863751 RepID=UPI0034CF590C